MQLKCYKFDETKVNEDDTLVDVILKQYNLSEQILDEKNIKMNPSDLFMPEEEQDKMADWIIDNCTQIKKLVPSKTMRRHQFGWVRLDIFPSSVERD